MDSSNQRQPGAGVNLDADLDALLADHVRDAELVTGCDAASVSEQMLGRAAAMSEPPGTQVVLIECNPRGALLCGICRTLPSSARGLERIAIKYVTSANVLRAMLAAWHCCADAGACAASALTERDFLVWDPDRAPESSVDTRLPDCLLIDGIDAIASPESMPSLWALMNSVMDYINRQRRAQDKPPCRLVIGLVDAAA
ncbi:hypothetical protein H4R19_000683 [Coemansia spiralis]|nr:hypothetical protein H4R19_000683 [Coemansia spiralis]